jgi:hypothetical protein
VLAVAFSHTILLTSVKSAMDAVDKKTQRFLEILDEYQRETEKLSNELREGFLQLAKANFGISAANTRFGQDMYDERMRRIAKVEVGEDGEFILNRERIEIRKSLDKGDKINTTDHKDDSANLEKTSSTDALDDISNNVKNPLHMFGIIVPSSLRLAQGHFVKGVDTIPTLINCKNRLEQLEVELNKELPFKQTSTASDESFNGNDNDDLNDNVHNK